MKIINKMNLVALVIMTLFLASACKGLKVKEIKTGNGDPTTTLLISHYKVECATSFKQDLCLQIKKKGSTGNWEAYAADIKNFSYSWGYDYEIEVTYKDISPKPTDAPARKYTFKKQISKTKTADTSLFVLRVSRKKTADAIKKSTTDNTLYKVYNEVDLKCDPADECTSLENNISQDNAIKFILSHDSSISNRLNISSIACASSRASFKTDCKD